MSRSRGGALTAGRQALSPCIAAPSSTKVGARRGDPVPRRPKINLSPGDRRSIRSLEVYEELTYTRENM